MTSVSSTTSILPNHERKTGREQVRPPRPTTGERSDGTLETAVPAGSFAVGGRV
ncbi:MAG: hypothetical protein ACOX9C_02060 [Kiritimatiellia bacterium]